MLDIGSKFYLHDAVDHVPEKVEKLIPDCKNNFSLRVSSVCHYQRHNLCVSVCTGHEFACEISGSWVPFWVHFQDLAPNNPLIKAFMDDLSIATTSVPGCRWLLQGVKRLISWTIMSIKPAKSSSLVLRKEKLTAVIGETCVFFFFLSFLNEIFLLNILIFT